MKHKSIMLLIPILIIMITGCTSPAMKQDTKDYTNVIENQNISIPGYEKLDFKAGKTKQNVNFNNPEENTCYFRMTLELEDDSEEDTVLWTSELIEPDEKIENIKLEKALDKGEYPAILKYECFSLKDESPLNGSAIELTIDVR